MGAWVGAQGRCTRTLDQQQSSPAAVAEEARQPVSRLTFLSLLMVHNHDASSTPVADCRRRGADNKGRTGRRRSYAE